MHHLLRASLLALGLASGLSAQSKDGQFIVAGFPKSSVGGGLFVADAQNGTMTALTGVTGDLKWASAVEADPKLVAVLYVGTNGGDQSPATTANVYRVLATNGKLLQSKKLNSSALTGETRIYDVAVAGDTLYFLSNTRFASMPIGGGKTTTIFTHKVRNPRMACDGRYAYFNFDSGGLGFDSCHRMDLQDTKAWKTLFSPQFPFPTVVWSLSLSADGGVVVLDKGNFSGPDVNFIERIGGKADAKRKFGMFPPHFRAWKSCEDPGSRDVLVIGSGKTEDQLSSWRAGKLLKGPFGTKTGNLAGLTVRRAPWLHRFGHICKPSKTEPQFFGNSVPSLGNAKYALKLETGGASAGLFMLGASGKLPTPIALSSLGMGTCVLSVFPILTFPVAVPATGSLNVALPIPMSLGATNLDVQFVLVDSGANKANLTTTQVGQIIVR